jgi:hypothetical protein
MSAPVISRLYIRDTKTQQWHEVDRAGTHYITTFCGRQYQEATISRMVLRYDRRTTWPPHRAPRCKTCVTKALKSR